MDSILRNLNGLALGKLPKSGEVVVLSAATSAGKSILAQRQEISYLSITQDFGEDYVSIGDALWLAEPLPTHEAFADDCLSRDGIDGYTPCDTVMQENHMGAMLEWGHNLSGEDDECGEV